ncbi:hypothetical protein D3C87_1822740 [compost metagenome]
MADGLEIFLDELVATLQQNDGAACRHDIRSEQAVADFHAAMAGKIARGVIVRRRVFRRGAKDVVADLVLAHEFSVRRVRLQVKQNRVFQNYAWSVGGHGWRNCITHRM